MHLTETEHDRLLVFLAAELARRRRADGVLLNVPEATALIADAVCEVARRGGRHAEAAAAGRSLLRPGDVLAEVPYVVRRVAVEAVFADGSRLVVVDAPFGPVPERDDMPGAVIPAATGGEVPPDEDGTHAGAGPHPVALIVENTSAVPISVTSHFHFFEANPRLRFDRAAAYGRHLDVPAGTYVRFEPGVRTQVRLVPIRGARVVIGFAGLVDGALDAPGALEAALERAHACGYLDSGNRVTDALDPGGTA